MIDNNTVPAQKTQERATRVNSGADSDNLCAFNLFAARIFKNPVESIIYDVAEFSRE